MKLVIGAALPIGKPVNGLSLDDEGSKKDKERTVEVVLVILSVIFEYPWEEDVEKVLRQLFDVSRIIFSTLILFILKLLDFFLEYGGGETKDTSHWDDEELKLPELVSDLQKFIVRAYLVFLGYHSSDFEICLILESTIPEEESGLLVEFVSSLTIEKAYTTNIEKHEKWHVEIDSAVHNDEVAEKVPVACQNINIRPPFHVSIYQKWSGKSDVFIEISQILCVVRGLLEELVVFLRFKLLAVIFDVIQCVFITFGVIKKEGIFFLVKCLLSSWVFELVNEMLLDIHGDHEIDDVRVEFEPDDLLLKLLEFFTFCHLTWLKIVTES